MTEFLPVPKTGPLAGRLAPATLLAVREWIASWNRHVIHCHRVRFDGCEPGAWPVADAWCNEPVQGFVMFEPLIEPQRRRQQAAGQEKHPLSLVLRPPKRWEQGLIPFDGITMGGWFNEYGATPGGPFAEVFPPPAWKDTPEGRGASLGISA